jgi:hypothetical protein
MSYSGCYSLEFYCDNESHIKEKNEPYYGIPYLETVGHNRTDCIHQAISLGWKIERKTHKCYCPECVKNKVKEDK